MCPQLDVQLTVMIREGWCSFEHKREDCYEKTMDLCVLKIGYGINSQG